MDDPVRKPSPENANQARRIYEGIMRDAGTARFNNMDQWIKQSAANLTGAPSLDASESKKIAELEAACNSYKADVEPLNAQINSAMNLLVLAQLLARNEAFLRQIAAFEDPARDLNSKGRPRLLETLRGWEHNIQATNAMIQYVFRTRQHPPQPAPPPSPPGHLAAPSLGMDGPSPLSPPQAPMLTQQQLVGIWDLTASGIPMEFAMDASTFSYARRDKTFAFWGTWSLEIPPASSPLLCLTRKGGYPVAYYGPLGSQPLTYRQYEVLSITAFAPDRISFGNDQMVRRKPVPIPLITARIADVQAEFQAADVRDQNNVAFAKAQHNAIASIQSSMWDYINSGIGRIK